MKPPPPALAFARLDAIDKVRVEWAAALKRWQELAPELFRLYRAAHRLNQGELAALLSTHLVYVSDIERGHKLAGEVMLERFARMTKERSCPT